MAWQTPKTNWKAGDVPSSGDFNRIEGNIKHTLEEAGKVNTVNNVSPDSNKNITLQPSDIGAVPATRRINGKALSSDILLTGEEVLALPSFYIYCDSANGSDSNTGLSSDRALKTLSKAIQIASTKVTNNVYITLAPGVYSTSSVVLETVFANFIYIRGTYPNGDKTIIEGNFNLDGLDGKNIKFLHCRIHGNVEGSNAWINSFRLTSTTVLGNINLKDCGVVEIWNNSITGTMYPVELENVGAAVISSNTLVGNYSVIRINNVGSCVSDSNTISLNDNKSDIAAIDVIMSRIKASRNKGSLGSVPLFSSYSSIIFEGNNTTDCGVPIKRNGGQIFTY